MALLHSFFLVAIVAAAPNGVGATDTIIQQRIDVDWSAEPTAVASAIPTFLDQVNPSMDRTSPMHDVAFKRMDKLAAKMVGLLRSLALELPGFLAPLHELLDLSVST